MNTNFYTVLNHSKETKSIIALFNEVAGNHFWAGYVLDFNDEFVTFQHVSKFGKLDGILVEPMYKIRRIDVDDYCKCLNYLVQHQAELDTEQPINFSIPADENWMYQLLDHLNGETDYISRIQLANETRFSGFITALSEEDFQMKCVGEEGTDEGTLYFQLDDVSSIRMNDLEARRRLMLYHYRRSIDFYDE